jgi:hypothetical protein
MDMEALCYALVAGYPVLGGAFAVLWRAYLGEKLKREAVEGALLLEKERKIRELEALQEALEGRRKGSENA